MKNVDAKGARDNRTEIKWGIHAAHFCVRMELVIQKTADIFKESWLIEITGKYVDGFGIASS